MATGTKPLFSPGRVMSKPHDGGMTVNNNKVRIGPLGREDKSEADIVQLLVPLNYVGELELRTNVDTKGDYWNGGINLFAGRPATVKFENVTVGISGEIDTSGYANLLINKPAFLLQPKLRQFARDKKFRMEFDESEHPNFHFKIIE